MSEKYTRHEVKEEYILTCDGCGKTSKHDHYPSNGISGFTRRYGHNGNTPFDLCSDCEINALKNALACLRHTSEPK